MTMFGMYRPDADPVDEELPEHLCAIHLVDWLALIARLDIPSERKTVAMMAASWASHDGSQLRPALQTVADMAKRHETNARKHLQALVDIGMLVVKQAGGGRGRPTVYRLTRPADITTLPLWLDADMRRVEKDAVFVPAKTPAHALGNELSSNTDSPAAALGIDEWPSSSNAYSLAFTKGVSDVPSPETPAPALPIGAETPAPALGNRPVDNFSEAVKGSDSALNPSDGRSLFAETLVPALPDLLQADPKPDQHPGLRQATNSLGPAEREAEPPALAAETPPADPEPLPFADDPQSPIVRAAAVLSPVPALAAALALLEAQPNGGEWYRAAAVRELRDGGIRHPRPIDIALRAIAILRRTDPETRSA